MIKNIRQMVKRDPKTSKRLRIQKTDEENTLLENFVLGASKGDHSLLWFKISLGASIIGVLLYLLVYTFPSWLLTGAVLIGIATFCVVIWLNPNYFYRRLAKILCGAVTFLNTCSIEGTVPLPEGVELSFMHIDPIALTIGLCLIIYAVSLF